MPPALRLKFGRLSAINMFKNVCHQLAIFKLDTLPNSWKHNIHHQAASFSRDHDLSCGVASLRSPPSLPCLFVRFIVMQDRWDRVKFADRSVEDLKSRYYSICNTLNKVRDGLVFV